MACMPQEAHAACLYGAWQIEKGASTTAIDRAGNRKQQTIAQEKQGKAADWTKEEDQNGTRRGRATELNLWHASQKVWSSLLHSFVVSVFSKSVWRNNSEPFPSSPFFSTLPQKYQSQTQMEAYLQRCAVSVGVPATSLISLGIWRGTLGHLSGLAANTGSNSQRTARERSL